jgi:hypothetical protein
MFRFKLCFLIAFLTFVVGIVAHSVFDVKRTDFISLAPQSSNVSPIPELQKSELIPLIPTEKVTQDSNLSLCNFGGDYEAFDNSREFVWKHWQDRK